MPRRALAFAAALSTLSALGPSETSAAAPAGPSRRSGRRPPPALGELSHQGTDRGELELVLGSFALGVVAALGVTGTLDLVSGFERREICDYGFETSCGLIPESLDFAAAGLSYGLMVPFTVAGALLLRRGIRIRRDHRAFRAAPRASLGPGLVLRF